MPDKAMRILLGILTAFLGLTAIAGGVGLLTGVAAPPVEVLAGSPFNDYTLPGLALLFLVGGSGLTAAYLTARRWRYAPLACAAAGAIIVIYEVIEILIIGSPPGIARNLQIFYFTLGVLILLLSFSWQWGETIER
ncbi:MAG: hypothetical protein QME21_18960 [Anaerolineales bacterium]|nr:hypothetical protein [Anaerolineales bacterium]